MFIRPAWPAPTHIQAYTTLRKGGVSLKSYNEFNLADHVGDLHEHVAANRQILTSKLQLPDTPIWIEQTHSTKAIEAIPEHRNQQADASFTREAHRICAVLTADCLPILLCNQKGNYVAAIHAGWRGLLHGIIEATIEASRPPDDLIAWLGPAIGPNHFEVGPEVHELFIKNNQNAEQAFIPSSKKKHYYANLYTLAKLRLSKLGITTIYGGNFCTFSTPENFYSYRRDGNKTGRMATLIWINQ